MNRTHVFLVFVTLTAGFVGCSDPATTPIVTEPDLSRKIESDASLSESKQKPHRITNQFGMTFCLVTIDSSRSDHDASFPSGSYYLQQTELRWEKHNRFRDAAFGDGLYGSIDWGYNLGMPLSDWHLGSVYAEALSEFDSAHDYRLPNVKEWSFACKDGYDQRCPE